MKKLKPGTVVHFSQELRGQVRRRSEDGTGNAFIELAFNRSASSMAKWLDSFGYIPLPPYIKRLEAKPAAESSDRERYQTVYASNPGSVAAPTAGLHFTNELLTLLQNHSIQVEFVSLHVGAGTFLPVKSTTISAHKMHAERYRVGHKTASALLQAKQEGRPIVAVGTTTLRSLEALYRTSNSDTQRFIQAADEWRTTDLFIYPAHAEDRYRPWVVDGLFTNFHQPCSTLFMLVSALIGLNEAKTFYQAAIGRKMRLFSYGDASLLWF
jgi:S-adenosylmethionine:tRNA ribosyltransferase-isomerase